VKDNDRVRRPADGGFTLVELMVAITIMAALTALLTAVLISSGHTQRRTMSRAEVQSASRQTIALMATELRQTGSDPRIPPVGVVGVVTADSQSVRIRADLDADGTIETTEPSEDITFSYDANGQTVLRNPGTGAQILQNHVTEFHFTYFDSSNQPLTSLPLSAADRALVHSIGLTLTCRTAESHPLTLTTRITLRNQ
jgi:prepilin-type N-terminal cleavage/methylation domain-containing protein